jgi:Protein of unknown function (DUF995)
MTEGILTAMKTNMTKQFLLTLSVLALTGCTSMSIFKDSPEATTAVPAPEIEPAPVAPGQLSAAEIKTIISGKSWKWTGPKLNGVTLYADDGSSLVEVTGKGTTTGKWVAKDGQLCESFAPGSNGFLPNGVPMSCKPFSGSNGRYNVGSATFTLA